MSNADIRHDWRLPEVRAIYDAPITDLVFRAQAIHRAHHPSAEIQLCSLQSVKTGGCSEDCGYCSQSSHHHGTGVAPDRMMTVEEVLAAAKAALGTGATRFCMGAAWRQVKDGPAFEAVLQMVRGVRALGLEACCTLGMVDDDQARALAEAGLTAYNHNLDTSREFYPSVVSTRSYDERLATIERVQRAGIEVCAGGIIGMGESLDDRCRMLITLAALDPHPDSVPINSLVPVAGSPLAKQPPVDPLELVRTIGTARILMPGSTVRLSAGRSALSDEAQVLCFLAGANSVFYGDRLLTTGNPDAKADQDLLRRAGLVPRPRDNCGAP